MKKGNKYFPLLFLLLIGVAIELSKSFIDHFFGDGDGNIRGVKIIPFAITQFFIGIIIAIWIWKELSKNPKIKKLSFTIFLIALFLVSEVVIRLNYSHTNLMGLTGKGFTENPLKQWAVGEAYCAYKPKPGSFGEEKTVNSFGFISTPELSYKKPENTIRIAFFGGSSTAGTGTNLPDNETWPWKTTEMLKQKFPGKKFDFINASSGGYSSFESYGRYWSRIRFFEPDIIIVNHGWNDMYYFDIADSIFNWRNERNEWTLSDKKLEIYQPKFIDNFISWSQVLSKLRLVLSKPNQGEIGKTKVRKNKLDTTFNYKGIEIFSGNMSLFKSTSGITGNKIFICKQPTLIVPNLAEEDRKRCKYHFHGFDHNTHLKAFNAIYKSIDTGFSNNEIIDLTSISGKSELFYDHIHPTPNGTTQYAKIVSDSIASYLQKYKFN